MTKDEKKKQAEALREELAKSRSIFMSGFEGLTVAQDAELRRKVAQVGARYQVVKNTVIRWAAQGTPVEALGANLRGTTSVAYGQNAEPTPLAKVLTEYAKGNPAFVFKTGMVEGRLISMADLGMIAVLPGREELFSKALFLIKSPAQRVASCIAGVARNLACVIQQAVKEKTFLESSGT